MTDLFACLPPFFRDIREFRAVFAAAGEEIDLFRAQICRMLDDLFVETADEAGLKRLARSLRFWENCADPEDLRFALRSLLLDKRPYTMRMLDGALCSLCGADGYELSEDVVRGVLTVRLKLGKKDKFNAVRNLLERIVPVDMAIDADYLYNTHGQLSEKTHGQLSAYTHEQLRSEVL